MNRGNEMLKHYNSANIVTKMAIGIIVLLFFTHNILYWIIGILITQFCILSNHRLTNIVDRFFEEKIHLHTFSHFISLTSLSILGFIICLAFFSITESISPARDTSQNSILSILSSFV